MGLDHGRYEHAEEIYGRFMKGNNAKRYRSKRGFVSKRTNYSYIHNGGFRFEIYIYYDCWLLFTLENKKILRVILIECYLFPNFGYSWQ